MATLEQAIALAALRHEGQLDKAGEPYILHVMRVINGCKRSQARIAAALHDLVEDTSVTLVELLSLGFSSEVVDAVDCLTKRKGETRMAAAKRAKANPIALEVKLSDNADNLNILRLKSLEEKDLMLVREYFLVRRLLLSEEEGFS